MGKSYIYNEGGNRIEEQELSVEGEELLFCEKCQKEVWHQLIAISSTRGYVYACPECGGERGD